MKKALLLMSVFSMFSAALFFSGCSETTTEVVGSGTLYGTITDLSGNPIPEAIVSTSPASMIDTADNQGRFLLTKIKKGTYYVIFNKPGTNFAKDSIQKIVNDKDSLLVNFSMHLRSDVLIFNNIQVANWRSLTSYSGLDCYLGKAVQENPMTYDMQLRDSSMFNPDTNIYFRSGHISKDKKPAGYRTYFSDLVGNYTEAEWSNLNYFPTFVQNQTITETNALSYFLYDQIPYFNIPLPTQRPVYGFWLYGRYSPTFNGGKHLYGMIYIKSYNASVVTVDLKLTLIEKNNFIQTK